jgi:hypothetical protein
MRNDALRKIVRLDLIGNCQTLQLGHQPPMPSDNATHQAFMAKVVEPTLVAVALSSRAASPVSAASRVRPTAAMLLADGVAPSRRSFWRATSFSASCPVVNSPLSSSSQNR